MFGLNLGLKHLWSNLKRRHFSKPLRKTSSDKEVTMFRDFGFFQKARTSLIFYKIHTRQYCVPQFQNYVGQTETAKRTCGVLLDLNTSRYIKVHLYICIFVIVYLNIRMFRYVVYMLVECLQYWNYNNIDELWN